MFTKAFREVSKFTKPVIISTLHLNDECSAGVGSFVLVNADGWILTAAHIVQQILQLEQQRALYQHHGNEEAAIQADASLDNHQKARGVPETAIKDYSPWWSADGVLLTSISMLQECDLAVGRLQPFTAPEQQVFPRFLNPARSVEPGVSLCRMGFPFHDIKPAYDGAGFRLPEGTFPMCFFPNEGILTRSVSIPNNQLPYFQGFIETSSPGLMGQSGGPIFDQAGVVWGIQSHTTHLPLGFNPPVPNGRPEQTEHQFLNVGRGVHPATITGFLGQLGIAHELSQ